MSRIDGHQRRFPRHAETAGILPIDDRAAGKDHDAVGFREGQRQVLPVHQIAADGMPPAHVSPTIALRIVLIKQVPLAVVEHHAVRIIHPIPFRREMELRPERFAVTLLSLRGGLQTDRQCNEAETSDHVQVPD